MAYSANEDFTTWSLDGTDAAYTITASKVSFANSNANGTEYYGDDKGVGHFGEFKHDWKGQHIHWQGNAYYLLWGVGDNSTGDEESFETGNDGIGVYGLRYIPSSPDENRIYLKNYINDSTDFYATDTNLYETTERTASTIKLYVYSDAARTNLLDTMSVTYSSNTFRYIFVASMGGANSASNQITGSTENLNLNETTVTFKPFAISY